MTEPHTRLVVGVDPGLTTGLVALRYGYDPVTTEHPMAAEPICVQIHGHEGVTPFVRSLIDQKGNGSALLSVEAFVVGPRASRSSNAHAGKVTRTLIGALGDLAGPRVQFFSWNASIVKTWANDRRLDAAGLLETTKGMRHARDAARHALYAAVKQGVTRDPLNAKAVQR